MPIYEYRCDDCGHRLDALQRLADDLLRECPACRELSLRRLVSAPAFRLKGKGWYETDFKSDKETRRNIVDGPEDSPGGKDRGDSKKDEGSSADKPSGKPGAGADSKSHSGASSGKSDTAAA